MEWAQIFKIAMIALVVCAGTGGIVSQTAGGVSGRGFLEGMWKGVEWFFIGVAGMLILWGVSLAMGMISNALNT